MGRVLLIQQAIHITRLQESKRVCPLTIVQHQPTKNKDHLKTITPITTFTLGQFQLATLEMPKILWKDIQSCKG